MAGRAYNVSFNITGAMDGSLLSALRNAANAMKGLGNSARAASASTKNFPSGLAGLAQSLGQLQSAAQKFRDLKRAVVESQQALNATQSNTNQLAAQFNRDKAAAEKLRQELEKLRLQRRREEERQGQSRASLKFLRDQRAEIKAQLKELGAIGKKIPRELLGTDKGKQIGSLLTRLTENKAALEAARQKFQEQQSLLTAFQRSISETQKKLREAERAANQSGQGFNSAKSQAASLKATLEQQRATLQQLRSQLGAAGFSTSGFINSERQLQAEIERVNAALRQQQALLQARQGFNQSATNLAMSGAELMGAKYTAEQIAEPFTAAAKNAMDFEFAMSKVKALTQMRNIRAGDMERVRVEMEALTKQAEQLGAATEFTATEIAEGMGYFGMAGWDFKQIQAMMKSAIDLASISGDHNLQRTTDVLSDDMTAMGIKAGESLRLASGKVVDGAEYFTDAFAYAITQANLNREQLHEALKYNAPTAKAAELSLGETFAMNMVAANAGIKGSMGGTSFRQGWIRFLAPPKQAAKALAEMGSTASDATREVLEAGAALESIGVSAESDTFTKITKAYEHYQTLDKNARASFLKSLVGQTALSAWQNVFDKGNMKQIIDIAREIDSGAIEGWAVQTAEVMRDNTKTELEYLNSALDALQKSAGDALLPALRSLAQAFTPLVQSAAQWVAQNPAIIQGAAAIAAAFSTIIVGAAAVKLAFAGWGFITSTVAMVKKALASLGSGAMLGGLIGRLAALRTALFGLGGAATLGGWGAMFGAIAAKAAAARVAITGFFASLSLGSVASAAATGLRAVGTAIAGAARAAFAFAFSPVGVALMAIALAGMYCYQNWSTVGPVLSQIAGIVTGALAPAFAQIKAAIDGFTSSGGFEALSSAASQLANVVGGTLVKAFAVLLTVAASAIAGVIQLLADLVTTIADIGTGISEAFAKIKDGDFSGAVNSLKDAGTKALGDIKTLGEHIFDGVEQGAKNVKSVLDGLNSQLPSGDAVRRHAVNIDANGVAHSAPEVTAPAQAPAPVAAPTSETPQIDATQAQAGLDALGNSAQTVSTSMDGVQQATTALAQVPQAVQPTTEGLQQVATSAQTSATSLQAAGTNAQTLATAAQAASTSVQALGTAADGAQGGITALGAAADGACAGTSALGSAASGAAGAVSGLGAAAQAACAQLAAAGANAAAQVNAAASAVSVKANYQGGIYRKGAFLTTFAEKSPEAAIPLDNSQRAKDLWTQAGQILGILPQTQPITFETTTPPFNPETSRGKEIPSQRQAPRRRNVPQIPRIPPEYLRTTQTMPRYGGDSRGGLIIPQIMTPPQNNSGGLFGDLLGKIFDRPQNTETSSPTINLTLNLTINGNADAGEVRRGVEESVPTMRRGLREEFELLKREQARRSFA